MHKIEIEINDVLEFYKKKYSVEEFDCKSCMRLIKVMKKKKKTIKTIPNIFIRIDRKRLIL